jgi:hypothetical protein
MSQAEKLITTFVDEGLAPPTVEKLKAALPQVEKGAAFLAQTYGLSFDDSSRLALAINLLTSLPIPTKLLSVRPPRSSQQQQNQPSKQRTNSNYDSSSSNPSLPFNQSYSPYAPYSMYQYPQGSFGGITSGVGGGGASAGGSVGLPGHSQTTLFVRNLPNTITEQEVLSVFQQYGVVKEARFQKNKETQQFSGSVFLEYIHSSAARLAQVQLNEKLWGERLIHIDFAKERLGAKDGPQTQVGGVGVVDQSRTPSNVLYVSSLPPECDKNHLTQLFGRFGTILDARTLKKDDGSSKGIAFIDFALQESAAAAIDALDGSNYLNRTIKVAYAANPSKRKGDELGEDPDSKRFRGGQEVGFPGGGPMYFDPTAQVYPIVPTGGQRVGAVVTGVDPSQQWGYGGGVGGQGYY